MINQALRYFQSWRHFVSNFAINKRFINLNVFIVALVLVLIVQSLYSYGYTGSEATHNHLLLLKNEAYSTNYDSILNKYEPNAFRSMSLDERCTVYFDHLHKADNAWMLNNFNTDGYDDNYIDFQDFVSFKKSLEKDTDFNEAKILELEKEFNDKSFEPHKIDQRIIDAMTTLRIFGKCFLDSNDKKAGYISTIFEDNKKSKSTDKDLLQTQHLCQDTEARIVPWLSNILPTYTRWDGEVSLGIPNLSIEEISKNYDDSEKYDERQSHKREIEGNCFLRSFRKSINGQGIVLSASDGQKGELMKLALVLRALDNKLPIQIVHKGDLSAESQKDLINEFRRPITTSNLPLSFEKLSPSQVPKFLPQDLWFVNVEKSIKSEYGGHFSRYANKLLAYFFNSFEDMILIDTDTVPFVDLKSILELPGFVKKGAYFFQDRQLKGSNTQNQVNYFKRLFPSKLDHHFFDIPQVTDFTLKNRFIGGLRNHFMESGVVAIKRSTHFIGMLSAIQLNFWSITANKIHGDKELFWLGQSIAGNENYEFNALGAAAVGELTPEDNKLFSKTSANELCGNHPGHINGYDNKTLLWINSGFTFCKNVQGAQFDKGKPLFRNYDTPALEEYYRSVTTIRSAIVPPPQEIDGTNDLENPTLGWNNEHKYCYGYTWCAYEAIGSMQSAAQKGLLVNFDDDQNKIFDFFGDLWMGGVKE